MNSQDTRHLMAGSTFCLGIIVHSTAGLFDPGWMGNVVIELGNLGVMPVALYPRMRICALTFEKVSSRVSVPYHKKPGNKYAGQTGPVASKIFDDKGMSETQSKES